jgi:nucleoside-diphosphate-sugar epimerase
VTGFDLADGQDLLDAIAVRRAAQGCGAVVHLGALAHDSAGSPEQIMAVNVLGTWHVLLAAEAAGAGRVVSFSSAQVFGIAEGEQLPLYFPVDQRIERLRRAEPRRSPGTTAPCCARPTAAVRRPASSWPRGWRPAFR